MKYLYKELKAPTRLYIKQCPHCGLKYFGKSVKQDIKKYQGSGKKWLRHLKKHNVKPIHLWNSDWYYDTSITRFALKFSRLNKIVEKNVWANLKEEDGLDGGDTSLSPNYLTYIQNLRCKIAKGEYIPHDKGTNKPRSKESIEKQRKTITGKKRGPYKNYNYNASAKRVLIYGTIYKTIAEARKATGHSYYTLKKNGQFLD